jgi:CBS domain containing-hemolysin-like protein
MTIPVLLALSALSVSASLTAFGAALVSVDRGELERRHATGSRRAGTALTALRRLGPEIAELRAAVAICTVVVGAVIEPFIDSLVGSPGVVDTPAGRPWTVLAALLVAIGAQAVVGEMVAASVGAQRPVGTIMSVGSVAHAAARSVSPLVALGDRVARRAVGGAGTPEPLNAVRSNEELRRLVQLSERSGAIRRSDAELFDRTLRFGEKTAADALRPRVEVVSLPADGTVGDLVERSGATGYSRFPVQDEDLDHLVGVVHVKDVLSIPLAERDVRPLRGLVRPVHVVPESKDLESLMLELRDTAGQFAVVVDEYGGTAGIVTLEDLIEEIVGDIADEHDPALAAPMVRSWGGAHLLDGSLHPDEVLDACRFEVPEGEYETLAGFVMSELGRVPAEGDRFELDGWDVEVVAMDGHRIRTVKIVAPSPEALRALPPPGAAPLMRPPRGTVR